MAKYTQAPWSCDLGASVNVPSMENVIRVVLYDTTGLDTDHKSALVFLFALAAFHLCVYIDSILYELETAVHVESPREL